MNRKGYGELETIASIIFTIGVTFLIITHGGEILRIMNGQTPSNDCLENYAEIICKQFSGETREKAMECYEECEERGKAFHNFKLVSTKADPFNYCYCKKKGRIQTIRLED